MGKSPKAGRRVALKITPSYEGKSLRPTSLTIEYTVENQTYIQTFKNAKGGK
jgi:hypothetical protein